VPCGRRCAEPRPAAACNPRRLPPARPLAGTRPGPAAAAGTLLGAPRWPDVVRTACLLMQTRWARFRPLQRKL